LRAHGQDYAVEYTRMLAEKFMLLLEALRARTSYADGSPRVISTSPHVPVQLPGSPTK
jgi:hypothetical protein